LDGAVNVCAAVESPFVGEVDPSRAAYMPEWAPVDTMLVVPVVVHPLKVPVSNPPFVMPVPPAGLMVNVTFVECVADGAVPVTVTVYVPAEAVPEFRVSVELFPAVTLVGLKLADAPAGTPLADRLIVSADPLVTAVEMVDVPLCPDVTVTLDGLALMEKSFVGVGVGLVQEGNLNEPMRVCQGAPPVVGMYSVVNQKVQSSEGSMVIME
jgi:hypothetical protein